MSAPTPTKPGRGMWTTTGGLLPPKPGKKGGFYRAPKPGETPVGAAGLKEDATYNEAVVTAGVKAMQRRLNDIFPDLLLKVDGVVGPKTAEGFIGVQAQHDLVEDGICGPKTVQAMVMPLVVAAARQYGIPAWALIGIVGAESGWDPAAVGAQTPWDTGLCQVNRDAHPAMSVHDATDFHIALNWSARELKGWRDRLGPLCVKGVDPDDVMTAAHNSPKAARAWAVDGKPGKSPDPSAYVAKVRQAWKDAS